jgi:hypothetical protein
MEKAKDKKGDDEVRIPKEQCAIALMRMFSGQAVMLSFEYLCRSARSSASKTSRRISSR